ncbi:MAG: AtpZ/AtpI family protein [Deltaproteobacteria bacterium]|nr:AtpZ/AtpI family protein [Deltaproteobacteria bacterium]
MSRRVDPDKLKQRLESQVKRMNQAEKDRPTLLAQTAYLGVVGFLFALPLVTGAYLGNWLDSRSDGYSSIWTLSLIAVGLITGVVNVCLMMRE